MGFLDEWANKKSPFIKLSDGGSIVGEYMLAEEVPNRFDPKSKNIRYSLLVEGEEKFFENGSASVARQFDKIEFGKKVKITRLGEDRNTTYKVVEVVDPKGKVSKETAEAIDAEMAG